MNPTRRRRREQDGLVVTTRGNRRLIMVNAASCSAGAPSGTCALRSPNMSPNGVGHVTVRCGLAAE